MPTLDDLIRDVGPTVLRVIIAPTGLDQPVGQTAIADPLAGVVPAAGDVVFAVGFRWDDADFRRLLTNAGSAGAAAVIVRMLGEPDQRLLDAASEGGVTVVGVDPAIPWAELHALVRAALLCPIPAPDARWVGDPTEDLSLLANAVAARMGCAVTIEDAKGQLLAYSTLDQPIDSVRQRMILERRPDPSHLKRSRETGLSRRIFSTGHPEYVGEELGIQPRLTVAVRAGAEILGMISVLEGERRFGAEDRSTLEEAARMAASHLLRHRVAQQFHRRIVRDLLAAALDGRGSVAPLAEHLDLNVDDHYAVIEFELPMLEDIELEIKRERALELVVATAEARHEKVAGFGAGRLMRMIIRLPTDGDNAAACLVASESIDQAGRVLGVELRAAIGSVVSSLADIHRSRRDADDVLRILAEDSSNRRVVTIDDVRSTSILIALREMTAGRRDFELAKLQRLSEYDARHGGVLVPTLAAWFDCFGDVGSASERVGIHPNTFRYRMTRIVEISGISLDDPDERLVTQLALRLSR